MHVVIHTNPPAKPKKPQPKFYVLRLNMKVKGSHFEGHPYDSYAEAFKYWSDHPWKDYDHFVIIEILE